MRTKIAVGLSLCLLALFAALLPPAPAPSVRAEEQEAPGNGRNIYAGDIITLDISAEGVAAEEIREAFGAEFEIVELRSAPGGEAGSFRISLRTFEPGEHSVRLGNKEIVVAVASTLDDFHRDDVFDGGGEVLEPGAAFPWRVLSYAAASVFVLSGGAMLFGWIRRRKPKTQTPYHMFLQRAEALAAEDGGDMAEWTLLLKTYIENAYPCRIIGKTSAELIRELRRLGALDPFLPELERWLAECDRFNYSGVIAAGGRKKELCETLLDLVGRIDRSRTAGQDEGAA